MRDYLEFSNREIFRDWLMKNGTISEGVWLVFGKKGGPKTLTATEALEEALCFGWIDGQMKSLDNAKYIKYFARRQANSKWSEKNKKLAMKLKEQGIMTQYGLARIAEAKKNGQWNVSRSPEITEEQICILSDLLKGHEPAYSNFGAMSPSIKKTYTRAYLDAKTETGQANRLSWIVDRLNQNLKPM
jgi:uncharacterized protein YdeI (YjbR/CyaY-like superfamily)